MFPFPQFQPPFPFPQPPTFAGLTDAEISEMEGRERRNIEARIQVLRNISVLLDAAVLQLQQYMSAAPQIHTDGPSFSPPHGQNTGEQKNSTAPSQHSEQDQPTTSSGEAPTPLSSEIDSQAKGQDENDELRKRRLAKFESESNPAAQPNAEN